MRRVLVGLSARASAMERNYKFLFLQEMLKIVYLQIEFIQQLDIFY
jgi:hypothetical protein